MFDTQTTGQGNAPTPGADDIFSGLDQGAAPAPMQPQAQFSVEDLNSAATPGSGPTNNGHESTNKRLMIVGGIVIGLLVLAIGVWLVLMSFKAKTGADTAQQADLPAEKSGLVVPAGNSETNGQKTTDSAVTGNSAVTDTNAVEASGNANGAVATATPAGPETGLPTAPAQATVPATDDLGADIPVAVRQAATAKADSDSDGLSDDEEQQIGTYSDRKDTDGDGLNDFEEVKTYLTNPKNTDSDSDGFKDGDEVKNGYNPKGSGKLNK